MHSQRDRLELSRPVEAEAELAVAHHGGRAGVAGVAGDGLEHLGQQDGPLRELVAAQGPDASIGQVARRPARTQSPNPAADLVQGGGGGRGAGRPAWSARAG